MDNVYVVNKSGEDKESGVSVVVGFVMVLAIIAIVIAIWAVLGVPGQITEAKYIHSLELENKMGDLQTSLYSLYQSNTDMNVGTRTAASNLMYSLILPVGSSYGVGILELENDVGSFSYGGEPVCSVDRLSVTIGSSEIGLEGGGVFRRDGDTAYWVISPYFDSGDSSLIIPRFSGSSLSVGSNGNLALDVWLTDKPVQKYSTAVKTYSPDMAWTYTANEAWDAALWYQFFYEESKKERYVTQVGSYLAGKTEVSGIYMRYEIKSPQFGIRLTPKED